MKQVRDELIHMQARQDSLFREMQRQNRELLDTMRSAFVASADAQGQTSFRVNDLADQVARTEQALIQFQTLVSQLMDRIDRLDRQPQFAVPPAQGAPAGSSDEAARAYEAGMQSMTEQSYPAARVAFQAIIDNFPTDPVAPSAQYQIAESYAATGDTTRAIAEFEKVESNWTHSDRAPEALLRAGILSEESGDKDGARRLYERVRAQYPESDAYRIAGERLNRIRG